MRFTDEAELQKPVHQFTTDQSELRLRKPRVESSLEDLSPLVCSLSVPVLSQRPDHTQIYHLLDPHHQDVYLLVRRQKPLGNIHLRGWLFACQVPSDDADSDLLPVLEHCGLCFLLHQLVDCSLQSEALLTAMLLRQDLDALILVVVSEVVGEEPLHSCFELLEFAPESLFALLDHAGNVGLSACVLEADFVSILRPHSFEGLQTPIVLNLGGLAPSSDLRVN